MITVQVELPEAQLKMLADLIAEKVATQKSRPLTPAELAEQMGVSERTIRRRMEAGLIARVPHLHQPRIPADEVERLLKTPNARNDR